MTSEVSHVTTLKHVYEPLHAKTSNLGFPTRSNTNPPVHVQSQKMARGLKFRIKEEM